MKTDISNLIPRYKDRLYAAAFNVCRNPEDAEDAVQEAFIRYYTGGTDFESDEHIRAWLFRVTINLAKNTRRSFWNKNRITYEEYMETLTFETPEDRGLMDAVLKLPEKYRVPLHLFYYEDYSVKEIAEVLQLPENTIKTRLSRARNMVKETIKEEWSDEFESGRNAEKAV